MSKTTTEPLNHQMGQVCIPLHRVVSESHNVCPGGIEWGRVFPKVKNGSGTKHINRLGHSTIEPFPAFHTFLGKEGDSGDCHHENITCQPVGEGGM